MQGSAIYPTFHYELTKAPANGVYLFDAATGKGVYTPNAGFTGIDRISYKIVSNYNDDWHSDIATIKIAVAEPWAQFAIDEVTAKMSPIDLAQYIKDRNLTAANMSDVPGITNIEPYKLTPYGKMAYANAKIAFELANGQYSWWTLSLGQKQ